MRSISVMDTSQDATQKRQEGIPLKEGVDLSRRRLFAWAKPQGKQQSRLADARVDAHDDVKMAQESLPTTVEPALLSELIVKHIRQTSIQGEMTCCADLPELFTQEPLLVLPEMSGEAMGAPQDCQLLEAPDQLSADEQRLTIARTMQSIVEQALYQDIVEVEGKRDKYYYTNQHMADNYVRMLVLMREEDHCATIAEMVRFESITYPRPYAVEALQHQPFFLNTEQIDAALNVMKKQAQYGDIEFVYASNNALYLYSDLHMTPAGAKGLCEWLEVEQFDNP